LQENNTFGLATLKVQIKLAPVIIQDFLSERKMEMMFDSHHIWERSVLLTPCNDLIRFPYFFLIFSLNHR
jgi:hypothetical protein